ncbi:TetR/AcrR family transcriptional regulator C-terminal domain-containing protein, partial [Actinomadura adrarensis]
PDEVGWREAVSAWAWALRETLQKRPWALRIPITGPPTMPNNVRWMETGLRAMRGMGLNGGLRISLLLLLSGLVRWEVTMYDDLNTALKESGASEKEMLGGYGQLLTAVTDPAQFPEVHALVNEKVFDDTGEPDDDFSFALELLLDGLETLVTRLDES